MTISVTKHSFQKKLLTGIEPATDRTAVDCSTTELQQPG